MTVQSAHMITTDYVALSQPLVDGILLNDRTDHKLKLIHSLGQLQPLHQYTTEYGNVLERTTKCGKHQEMRAAAALHAYLHAYSPPHSRRHTPAAVLAPLPAAALLLLLLARWVRRVVSHHARIAAALGTQVQGRARQFDRA